MFYIGIVFFLVLGIIIRVRNNLARRKRIIPTLLIGSAIILTVLIYPFSEGTNVLSRFVFSLMYAVQTVILNEDVSLVSTVPVHNGLEMFHIVLIYLLFLLMPLFTASYLISLLSDFTIKLKMRFSKNKDVIIFSELNEKSVVAAEKINGPQNLIIFASCTEKNNEFRKRTEQIKAIQMFDEIQNINFHRIKHHRLTVYMISNDEDENLNTTLQIIDKYREDKLKLYFITNESLSSTILDSVNKGNIQLEIVNEIERAVCEVLQEKPLYLNAINHKISVLIVGAGKVGTEFLKAITWCGQIIGYDLEINVIDIRANQIKEEITLKCPELISNYQFHFITVDVNSCQMKEELDKLKDINYIIVTLSNENDSLSTAIYLRRYFLNRNLINNNENPIINIWIRNGLKNIQVDHLHNQKGIDYEINAFGSISKMYFEKPIINSELEEMTKRVHLAYNDKDTTLEQFYKRDYNIRSSRAFALHIKYKIYSVLLENYTGNEVEDYNRFVNYLDDNTIFEQLVKNEHDRWNAYMRTIGFQAATPEQVKQYSGKIHHHVHHLAKLHPALVPYEELNVIEKKIGVSLIENDREIIHKLPNIIGVEKGGKTDEK